MTRKGKGVLIEEIMNHDDNDGVGKEFYVDNRYSGKLLLSAEKMITNWTFEFIKLLEEIDHEFGGWMMLALNRQMNENLYYGPNKVDFQQDFFTIYDQPIDDERDVVPVEVVAEEMVKEDAFDGDDGVISTDDGDLILDNMYVATVAQEMLEDDDRDVIPTEVYDEMVTQEMLKDQDGDVIPTKVYDAMVAQEMLED
uniref:Uncharacterized protein n=1 Tax=Tanacetum cinerariifolium TaxID=118510 RepID=A0A6L2KLK1_TANCI|nr:hypothetical protein [Tanacetum cinerariifolium]